MVDVQISSFCKFSTAFLVFIYGHFGTAEIALVRNRNGSRLLHFRIVLICRGVLAGCSSLGGELFSRY